MTQTSLDREVAKATGESVATIRRMGFSLDRPPLAMFDPEPLGAQLDVESGQSAPNVIDWDELDAKRMSIFPCHYGRAA